jgi:hypothetical protein
MSQVHCTFSAEEILAKNGLTEITKAKPFPVVGQICYIKHQVKRTSSGETLGLNRADGKPVAALITAVYLDGTVRTGISDVWEVTPGTNNTWETVNPFHGKSE